MIPLYQSFDALSAVQQPIHWAMGFFDGVHAGHRCVMQSAATPGALRGVLTFDRHPLALLCPEKQPLLLTPHPGQKAELIAREGGADLLLRLPFTAELAALAPEDFLRALSSACSIAGLSVGANWRFGRGAAGTVSLLRTLGEQRGWRICVNELAGIGGAPVSSSRIRAELAAGHLETVHRMLGRPFSLRGSVEPGQRLARQLGFPTANVRPLPHSALPPFGVYAIHCHIGSLRCRGIANLGLRPSIDEREKSPLLEAHLLDWQGDLYGEEISVDFIRFLRPERRFASIDELKEQVLRDREMVRNGSLN